MRIIDILSKLNKGIAFRWFHDISVLLAPSQIWKTESRIEDTRWGVSCRVGLQGEVDRAAMRPADPPLPRSSYNPHHLDRIRTSKQKVLHDCFNKLP